MKQLVVLSGKGGTGKTITAAALADLASRELSVVLVDADVDAANLELVLSPRRISSREFRAGQIAEINKDVCTACGRCDHECPVDIQAVPKSFGSAECVRCLECLETCAISDVIHLRLG